MKTFLIGHFCVLFALVFAPTAGSRPLSQPVVEVEENIYSFEPANNGAGPMWCNGSTCLVSLGDDLFASGLETIFWEWK